MMERWKGRVALVTGASVGIGAAVARALVQHGMKVVGCARNVDKIEVSDVRTRSLTDCERSEASSDDLLALALLVLAHSSLSPIRETFPQETDRQAV